MRHNLYLSQILSSASFRLTALYAVLFALSVLILAGLVYYRTGVALEEQLRLQIEAQVGTLMLEYEDEGLVELRDEIKDAIQQSPEHRLLYFLQNPAQKIIFDELSSPMRKPYGWSTAATSDGHGVMLYSTPLADGYVFGVGVDLTPVEDAKRAVLAAFAWALLAVAIIGIIGGLVLSRRFLRKIGVITELTERIGSGKLEARIPLRQTQDELDDLAMAINRMLDRIQLLMANVQRVSSNIAHDLRTPLGHLQQRLERIQEHAPPALQQELAEAEQQLAKTLEIFSAILRIAEIDSGSRRKDFVPLDLSKLFKELAEAFGPAIEENGQTLTCTVQEGLYVQGDRQLLMQLFTNLISNGMRHTPPGTEIKMSLNHTQSGVTATIADTGPGIPSELREEVFKPFYRLDSSRGSTGSGLGLSLVAAIASLHDATIEVKDNHPGLCVELHFTATAI